MLGVSAPQCQSRRLDLSQTPSPSLNQIDFRSRRRRMSRQEKFESTPRQYNFENGKIWYRKERCREGGRSWVDECPERQSKQLHFPTCRVQHNRCYCNGSKFGSNFQMKFWDFGVSTSARGSRQAVAVYEFMVLTTSPLTSSLP
jgi:hypothetical protein